MAIGGSYGEGVIKTGGLVLVMDFSGVVDVTGEDGVNYFDGDFLLVGHRGDCKGGVMKGRGGEREKWGGEEWKGRVIGKSDCKRRE